MNDDGDLPRRIAEVTGGRIVGVERLSGGASRDTFAVEIDWGGVNSSLIAQRHRPGALTLSLGPAAEAKVVAAAGAAGVPVAPVHTVHVGADEEWVLYGRVAGETIPRRILRDDTLAEARADLAFDVGAAAAAVHRLAVADLADAVPSSEPLEDLRRLADSLGEPHPAFELGFRRLEATRPPRRPPSIVHGDLRLGNLIVDRSGLAAVIDWELAHIGDPMEDLGWFCVRAWRFGSPKRAGGVGSVRRLLAGYASVAGFEPGVEDVAWWEAFGNLRWGVICLLQARSHLDGHTRSVELATIGRRVAESEWDLLALIDRSGAGA